MMAEINASIPLQVQPMPGPSVKDWASLAATGQQIEASKTAQRATEAGIPGIQAESGLKKRQLAFKDWQTNNVSKFVGPDGQLDSDAFIRQAAKDGYYTEAQGVATVDLENKAKGIANATNEQERQQALSKYRDGMLGHTATLLNAAPKDQRDALLHTYAAGVDEQAPGMGLGKQLITMFSKTDPKTNARVYNPDAVEAFRTATMTPLEQRQQAVSERSIALNEKVASPEYMERTSAIPGAGARVDALTAAMGNDAVVNNNNAAVTASAKLQSALGGRAGSKLTQFWTGYVAQDPAAQQYQQAIDGYNSRHGTNLTIGDGVEAINARLRQESAVNAGQATVRRNVAVKGNINAAADASPAPTQPAATPPPAAPGATVKMMKGGVAYNIPADKAQAALAKGFTPAGK